MLLRATATATCHRHGTVRLQKAGDGSDDMLLK